MAKPNFTDYPEYFGRYISQVAEDDLGTAFRNQQPVIQQFLHSISEKESVSVYAPGKWSIKRLLQHVIDAERIFNYRALCIARGETVSLPSFDENRYADNSDGDARSWESLASEFLHLRVSTEDLYNSFTPQMLNTKGKASDKDITVLSLGFITVGHVIHHKKVIEEKYLA